MGKYRGLDLEEGWIQRRFVALERALAEASAARRLGLQSEVRQVNLDPVALTDTWVNYGAVAVTPPDGYNVALVQMLATAGVSFGGGGGGNVGVQPKAGGVSGIGQSQGGGGTGAGAGCSITSGLAARLSVEPGVPFTIQTGAYANGPWLAGTGNVRFSATIIYTRE